MKYQTAKSMLRRHAEAVEKLKEATQHRVDLEVQQREVDAVPARAAAEADGLEAVAARLDKKIEELKEEAAAFRHRAAALLRSAPPKFDARLVADARAAERKLESEASRFNADLDAARATVKAVEVKEAARKATVATMEEKIKKAVAEGKELPRGETVESYARKMVRAAEALPAGSVVDGKIQL